jgi:hypothetical protein
LGMRAERPPEGWLLKAWDTDENDTLVDLIFGPRGIPDVGEVLERAEIVGVAALDLPVVHLDDVMVMKLYAFDEHACDYNSILAVARAVREQVHWESVRERTADSPFARGFFTIVEGLGIIGDAAPPVRPAQGTPQIKVSGEPQAAASTARAWSRRPTVTGVTARGGSVHERPGGG